MKKKLILITVLILLPILAFLFPVFAEDSNQNGDTGLAKDQRLAIIESIEGVKFWIKQLDETFDMFVGSTPDVTQDPIYLGEGNKSTISGLNNFRNAFIAVSGSILTLLIALTGVKYLTSNDEKKSEYFSTFLRNLLVTGGLLVTSSVLLSFSIKLSNAFSKGITNDQNFTDFAIDYFDNLEDALKDNSNDDKKQEVIDNLIDMFVPEQGKNMIAGLGAIRSLPYMISIAGLILVFLFVGYQFVIRFVLLLFLSLLYPLITPFYLFDQTRGFVINFWRTWTVTLLHQPAFILVYAVVLKVVGGMIMTGFSLNTLIVLVGSLVFLASVNVYIGKLVGDGWTPLTSNIAAGAATLISSKPFTAIKTGATNFLGGLLSGSARGTTAGMAGAGLGKGLASIGGKSSSGSGGKGVSAIVKGSGGGGKGGKVTGGISAYNKEMDDKTKTFFGKDMTGAGLDVKHVEPLKADKDWGVNSISGEVYSAKDKESGLTANFLSEGDALKAGYTKEEIQRRNVEGLNVIDPSYGKGLDRVNQFIKDRSGGKKKNTIISASSDPKRIKNFMSLGGDNFKSKGINGVVSRRWHNPSGKKSSERILTIYTDEQEG